MDPANAPGTAAAGFRHLVSSLLSSLPMPEDPSPSANPLRNLSEESKNVLLTLYMLFERELLSALDLLDRGLISRLNLKSAPTPPTNSNDGAPPHSPARTIPPTYLVRSAQQHHPRNSNTSSHINHHEVRPQAWNCSCPAFAFSAFPASAPPSASAAGLRVPGLGTKSLLGGLSSGTDLPVCKHLLACALVEYNAMFAQFANDRELSLEELAGWVAGWGD